MDVPVVALLVAIHAIDSIAKRFNLRCAGLAHVNEPIATRRRSYNPNLQSARRFRGGDTAPTTLGYIMHAVFAVRTPLLQSLFWECGALGLVQGVFDNDVFAAVRAG